MKLQYITLLLVSLVSLPTICSTATTVRQIQPSSLIRQAALQIARTILGGTMTLAQIAPPDQLPDELYDVVIQQLVFQLAQEVKNNTRTLEQIKYNFDNNTYRSVVLSLAQDRWPQSLARDPGHNLFYSSKYNIFAFFSNNILQFAINLNNRQPNNNLTSSLLVSFNDAIVSDSQLFNDVMNIWLQQGGVRAIGIMQHLTHSYVLQDGFFVLDPLLAIKGLQSVNYDFSKPDELGYSLLDYLQHGFEIIPLLPNRVRQHPNLPAAIQKLKEMGVPEFYKPAERTEVVE